MLHPSTTSELLLQQAVDLLTEVRDLLSSGQAPTTSTPPTPWAESTAPRPAAPRAPKTSRKT